MLAETICDYLDDNYDGYNKYGGYYFQETLDLIVESAIETVEGILGSKDEQYDDEED